MIKIKKSNPEAQHLVQAMEHAQKVVDSWPEWKKNYKLTKYSGGMLFVEEDANPSLEKKP